MRMRKKKNLAPRMERCAPVLIAEPETLKGHWLETFPAYRELCAEIGCGKGGFTCGTAKNKPETLLVALDKVADAMVIAMERCMSEDIPNIRFLDTDALRLPEIFRPAELSAIYINFPDPWPRPREAKHRLTSHIFLPIYKELLAVGGRIEFKTDQKPLFEYSLRQFEAFGYELHEVTRHLHEFCPQGVMTDYEAKFHAQGIPINRCVAVKTR